MADFTPSYISSQSPVQKHGRNDDKLKRRRLAASLNPSHSRYNANLSIKTANIQFKS